MTHDAERALDGPLDILDHEEWKIVRDGPDGQPTIHSPSQAFLDEVRRAILRRDRCITELRDELMFRNRENDKAWATVRRLTHIVRHPEKHVPGCEGDKTVCSACRGLM